MVQIFSDFHTWMVWEWQVMFFFDFSKLFFVIGTWHKCDQCCNILLMEEILHQLIGSLSRYLLRFYASHDVVVWDFFQSSKAESKTSETNQILLAFFCSWSGVGRLVVITIRGPYSTIPKDASSRKPPEYQSTCFPLPKFWTKFEWGIYNSCMYGALSADIVGSPWPRRVISSIAFLHT